ncbi:Uncharacterized protein dnm_045240 [Desulfonema magnum]|uniref:Uncharacterized protein n=1 Tax=Desulfonema magnum TaxID=45655 RepID=A0A975BMY7_9BACT|nr:Uncharacterized protein dnm_045240 [Desulfonema magnum]
MKKPGFSPPVIKKFSGKKPGFLKREIPKINAYEKAGFFAPGHKKVFR